MQSPNSLQDHMHRPAAPTNFPHSPPEHDPDRRHLHQYPPLEYQTYGWRLPAAMHTASTDVISSMLPPPYAIPHSRNMQHPYPTGEVFTPVYTVDIATKPSDRVRRRCFNCCTTDTATWRRSSLNLGKVLCNKCGLYERAHSRPRPERLPRKPQPLAKSLSHVGASDVSPPLLPTSLQQTPYSEAAASHFSASSREAPILQRASPVKEALEQSCLPSLYIESPDAAHVRSSPAPGTVSRAAPMIQPAGPVQEAHQQPCLPSLYIESQGTAHAGNSPAPGTHTLPPSVLHR